VICQARLPHRITLALALTLASPGLAQDRPATPKGDLGRGGGEGKERGDQPGEGKKAGGRGRRDAGPVPVRAETAAKKLLPRSLSVVAPLYGRRQADVFAKVTGRISFIGPPEGAKVSAGETLFKVDRSDPGESFLSAPVMSPIQGWVGRWIVTNVGEQVTPSEPVVTVVDDEFLRATVYLSTNDWVVVDQSVAITLTVGEQSRPGRLVSVARAADASSGRGSLVVEVSNQDHTWRVGMMAHVRVELDARERMILSSAALNITDQGAYVFVIEGDKAKRSPVTYRLVDSDTVELLSGVEDGAQVVVAGGNLLSDGAAVSIVPSATGGAH
jgi:multidrug efflux pump subunit AcrA (membrane-fusion protein)